MPSKIKPARVEAYLRALAQTGSQTIAAERARVSTAWARDLKRRDPGFAARVAAALAEATQRLGAAGSTALPATWRMQAGEELTIHGACGRKVQIQRARLRQWTPRTEARFLKALASCCNVAAACRAAGMSQTAAYNHYRRWPDFEKRWHAALEEGHVRLEMALFEAAGRVFKRVDYPPDVPIEPMTFDQAITLLKVHEARARRIANPRQRWRKPPPTADEAFESLERKLEAMARVQARNAAVDPAADRRAVERGMRIVREGGGGKR